MLGKTPTVKIFDNLGSCFHLDGAGQTLFSVTDFMRLNSWPDDPSRRSAVIETIREVLPDIPILEDWN
jgi:hypothetical protein